MTDQHQTIHWFPGHMMKSLRLIEKELRNVDLVIEMLDARIPLSSRNEELSTLTASKPRLIVLNKADLADETKTKSWMEFYKSQGYGVLAMDAKNKAAVQKLQENALITLHDKLSQMAEKGMGGRKPRAMLIGIPNVGKSTFINTLSGKATTKVEDRPGVTRGKQWVVLPKMELMDMPGVLPRKFERPEVGLYLAFIGSVKDQILDTIEIAQLLLVSLAVNYPDVLRHRYKLDVLPTDSAALLEAIAKKRGMLLSGGVPDDQRAAMTVLDELRGGKLGRITFEDAPDEQ